MYHTLQISGISDELLGKLDVRAREQGEDRDEFVRRLLETSLQTPTLQELLAPFRVQVEDSGMSDEELDSLFEEAREESYRKRQGKGRVA